MARQVKAYMTNCVPATGPRPRRVSWNPSAAAPRPLRDAPERARRHSRAPVVNSARDMCAHNDCWTFVTTFVHLSPTCELATGFREGSQVGGRCTEVVTEAALDREGGPTLTQKCCFLGNQSPPSSQSSLSTFNTAIGMTRLSLSPPPSAEARTFPVRTAFDSKLD
jgi:hypothetical protein